MKTNSRGMSLVETLVALGLLSIISMAIMSLIQSYNKNLLSVEEKLTILDLEKTLINLSAGKNICDKKFKESPSSYTFPVASFPPAAGLTIDGLFLVSTDTTGIAEKNKTLLNKNSISVESIELQNISGSGNSFFADLIIKFKDTVIPRKPIMTKVSLGGNIVGTNLVLTSCMVADATNVNNPNTIDNETACTKIGGEWIQPGGYRPDFCSYPGEILEWY